MSRLSGLVPRKEGKSTTTPYTSSLMRVAQVPTCHPNERHQAKGLCPACYQRKARQGSEKARAAHVKANIEWKRRNPERMAQYHRKSNYGLREEEFQDMLDAQTGLCAICHKSMKPVCVDHDHDSGKIRGLLCISCNMSFGIIEKLVQAPGFSNYWQKANKQMIHTRIL